MREKIVKRQLEMGWTPLRHFLIMNRFPVKTKTDFVRRYNEGEFGNRSPTWDSLEKFSEECWNNWKYQGESLYHLRNRVTGGYTKYNVTSDSFWHEVDVMYSKGVKQSDIYISEMCPTHKTLIQGEVMQRENGELYLYYSRVKKPMRDALKEGGREATGLEARLLLRHYMNQRSEEWLEHLLDSYPGHVIEFTTLSTCWGTVPGYNTLFWEVRQY